MQLARVIGNVVCTVKNDSLHGRKLLVVQTLDRHLKESGKPMIAVDSVGAGVGELVFWCRGKEASFPFKREDTPTDCTIIGIVDSEAHVLNTP
jgi:ethanolamine utilization protein EutN